MERFLWVCVGGALGSGARYLVSGWVAGGLGMTFPYGTLTVNLLGSFLLGLLMTLGISTDMSPLLRVALTTGCMGGFTTYSTFNYETLKLIQDGAWFLGVVNIIATVLVCLLAGLAGLAAARLLVSG